MSYTSLNLALQQETCSLTSLSPQIHNRMEGSHTSASFTQNTNVSKNLGTNLEIKMSIYLQRLGASVSLSNDTGELTANDH